MKHNIYRLLAIPAVLLCCIFPSRAQNEISNPYSGFGIGLMNSRSNAILDGMGGTSYAMQNPYYINSLNPASYVAFDSLSFTADVAASIFVSVLSQGSNAQRNSYAKPCYITVGLPLTRHWRTSLGIRPYSSVGYEIENTAEHEVIGKVTYNYSADGGLNQLYWGHAFKIIEGLSLGLNVSYLFGNIDKVRNTSFDGSNLYNSYINDSYRINGIHLTGGAQYFFNIKERHKLGIGLVYGNTAYIWSKENHLIHYYTNTYSSTTSYDTVYYNDKTKDSVHIPQSVGAGLSYSYMDKVILATDVTWQDWNSFKFMGRGIRFAMPYQHPSEPNTRPTPLSNKFLKKTAFRLGFRYSTGNIVLHNKPIDEMGVSLGIGIPLTTFNTHSSVNVAFEYGKSGTLANQLIKQNYFRFTLNFTLQEKWYQRMKLD